MTDAYVSATEAAQELGISIPTLYAYVSRGLVRSQSEGGSTRARQYAFEDIQALKARKEQRRDPAKAVNAALHWGTPILESAITLIRDGRLYYRGRDALELARGSTFEQVAALLWTGEDQRPHELQAAADLPSSALDLARPLPFFERFQVLLPFLAASDHAAYDLRPAAVLQTNTRILSAMAAIASDGETHGTLAQRLQSAWSPNRPDVAHLIDAALILCADHELNVSAFAARCVASAAATPYAAVEAGLAALRGTRHGGHTERVDALLHEVGTPDRSAVALAARLRRGESLPGFGQQLYPQGDPRATELLRLARETSPDHPALALGDAVIAAAHPLIGELPTLDFGLVVLSRVLGFPTGAPLALFAIGRTAGWLAHTLEQYAENRLIRPRARYVGVEPLATARSGEA